MCINKLGIELDAEYMYNELVFFLQAVSKPQYTDELNMSKQKH